MSFGDVVDIVTRAVEVLGIAILTVGALMATGLFLRGLGRGTSFDVAYDRYRQWLGRAILLGLEFLVAADIIGTVTISPTLMSVAILAAIVVIRTFLSIALSVEIEGRWPWQRVKV
jgi:uncharacterized membrane protein